MRRPAVRCKAAKADYDRKRRAEKRAQLRAYDAARNVARRANPEYAAAQLERKRKWRQANRERDRAVRRESEARHCAENPQRRIAKNLRNRIRKAMLGQSRSVSAVRDLGLSMEEFRAYLSSKFQLGMSWENYGKWHIDHIKPLAAFDLTDEAQARAACHYTNLQPLWALENQRKHCKPHPSTWPAFHAQAVAEVTGA